MVVNIKGEDISEEKINKALTKRIKGISIYIELMRTIDSGILTEEFKENFKKFYGMKRCKFSDEFYTKYFEYLDKNRKKNNQNYKKIEFNEVINYIWQTGTSNRVEASFCSKLLASINSDKPVWDRNVFSWLEMTRPASIKDKNKQIKKAIETYDKLIEEINRQFYNTGNAKKCIEIFNEFFNRNFSEGNDLKYISSMKKIDFILWSLGKK